MGIAVEMVVLIQYPVPGRNCTATQEYPPAHSQRPRRSHINHDPISADHRTLQDNQQRKPLRLRPLLQPALLLS